MIYNFTNMKIKLGIIMALSLLILPVLNAQPTQDEIELYHLITKYRTQHGLPLICLSQSLTYVAQVHAKDVYMYFDEIPQGCNPHSWSSHGTWRRCDYYPDHRNAEGMWSKPRELTPYIGNGYEIIHYFVPPKSGICTPQGALDGWKHSSPHNACILNQGIWRSLRWNAIGIGIYKGVACVWFGQDSDPAGYYIIQ